MMSSAWQSHSLANSSRSWLWCFFDYRWDHLNEFSIKGREVQTSSFPFWFDCWASSFLLDLFNDSSTFKARTACLNDDWHALHRNSRGWITSDLVCWFPAFHWYPVSNEWQSLVYEEWVAWYGPERYWFYRHLSREEKRRNLSNEMTVATHSKEHTASQC